MRDARLFTHIGLAPALACAVMTCVSPAASALTINLSFVNNPLGEPANDPDALKLQQVMQAAADAWEDIILDNHTISIEVVYAGDLGGFLATAEELSISGDRVTSGRIRFDGSNFPWYFDANADSDAFKFDTGQQLHRDLTTQQQDDWFNGTVPDLLETAYFGGLSPQAPAEAINATDVYSVALHEIGHLLGVPGAKEYDTPSIADGEYDIDPALVGGNTLAIVMVDTTPDEVNDTHLAAGEALMNPSIPRGWRRRISTIDVLAAASTANWSQIDLPRKEFIGGSFASYNTPGNWIGNRVPDNNDEVNMRTGATHQLTANGFAGDLFITEGTDLITNTHTLDTSGTINITQPSAATTVLSVSNAGRAEAKEINIDGGWLTLEGGTAVGFQWVRIEDNGVYPGEVRGFGLLGAPDRLVNDGVIKAMNGTLTIAEDPFDAITPIWQLDGETGFGVLDATQGSIVIDGPVSFPFDGDIHVGAGRSITFNENWTLDEAGDNNAGFVYLTGTPTTPATLNGPGRVTVADTGTIDADKLGHINAPVLLTDTGWLRAFNSDDTLVINGATTLSGGLILGNGTVIQNGDVTVLSDTTVTPGMYDWDGDNNDTVTTIFAGTLTLDAFDISADGTDTFRGTVNVTGGTLDMNYSSAWTMEGTMNLSTGFGSAPGRVQGSAKLIVTGELNVTGDGVIDTTATLTPIAQINVPDAGDVLTLNYRTELQGGPVIDGSIFGNGMVKANSDLDVTGDFQINTGVFDWDGDTEDITSITTIDPGVSFIINAPAIEPGGAADQYDARTIVNGGTLEVNTGTILNLGGGPILLRSAWILGPDARLDLNETDGLPATVGGSPLDHYGTIIANGDAVINAPVTFRAGSATSVGFEEVLTINHATGSSDYRGGAVEGSGTLIHNGDVAVNEPTTVSVALVDLDGPNNDNLVTVNSPLTLAAGTRFNSAPTTFAGDMAVNPGGSFNWDLSGAGLLITGNVDLNNANPIELTMMSVPTLTVSNGGTLDINGKVAVDGAILLTPTGNLLLENNQDVLHILGNDTNTAMQLVGATITGDGTLKVTGSNFVAGNGTIAVDIDFGNATSLEAAAGTLTITGGINNAGTLGTFDTTGTLNTPNVFTTANVQEVELKGGQWIGGTIIHTSLLAGHGTVATAAFINDGTVRPDHGTLIFDLFNLTPQTPDLDGTGGNGQILLQAGSVEVRNAGPPLVFNGYIEIDSGHSFVMPTGGLTLNGTMQLEGGTYDATQLNVNGNIIVSAGPSSSTIRSDMLINPGGTLTNAGDIIIDGSIEFDHDNALKSTSAGEVMIEPLSTLAGTGAQTARLLNYGIVQIGSPIGELGVKTYHHRAGATLEMQIGGTFFASEHDRLDALDTVTIDGGTLDLQLTGSYRFGSGDAFEIIHATNGLTGVFDTVTLDSIGSRAPGLIYDANSLIARLQLIGDLNFDGFVGIDDLNIVLASWNQNVTAGVWLLGDPSGDGFVGIDDLNSVLGNWNAGTPPTSQANIPEPASASLGLIATLALLMCRTRAV